MEEALRVVQALDPAGVGARDLRECLLLQIESVNGKGGVAWQIVSNHLRLLETRQYKEIAKVLGRPIEHVEMAVNMIQHLNPRPGLRYSGAGRASGGAGRLLHQGWRRLHHPDERRGGAAAPAECAVPPDARPRSTAPTKEVRDYVTRAVHFRHPADEEYRAAEADDPESLPVDRAAADAIS